VEMTCALAKFPASQSCAAFAGIVRDNNRKSLIARTGPERGLTQSRVANNCRALRIHSSVRLQIIQRAAQPPCPGADTAPFVHLENSVVAGRAQRSAHAILPALGIIGLDVAAVRSSQRIAALENHLQRK